MEFPNYCRNNNLHKRCSHCSAQCGVCDECDGEDCAHCPNVCEGFSFARGGHPSTPNPCEGFYRDSENYPIGYDCRGCSMLPQGW